MNDTEENDSLEEKGLYWDKPFFYNEGKIFVPHIYDPKDVKTSLSTDHNTVLLSINGQMNADLDWRSTESMAQGYVDKGLKLLWRLDLGLFKPLRYPLEHQTQFLSLILSLEHFRDTLWKKFKEDTLGVCLYEGDANMVEQLHWNPTLNENYLAWGRQVLKDAFRAEDRNQKCIFARDAAVEYLSLLANRMPDEMQIFVFLDVAELNDLAIEAQLVHRERYERMHVIVKNSRLPTFFPYKASEVGLALPHYSLVANYSYQGLGTLLNKLVENDRSFRLIPETYLINEWDGLNYLLVIAETINVQARRKLQGFCAAGGTVVTYGNPLGLGHEISVDDFFNLSPPSHSTK